MPRNKTFHKILSIIFIAIMCNTFIMPSLCILKNVDFSYNSFALIEEETKNSTNINIIEEDRQFAIYTTSYDFSAFEFIQNRQFDSKKLFLNDNYFKEILLPPPEQNLV